MLYNQWTAYLTKCYYFTNCDNFFINTTIYTQYTLYIILELQYIIFSQCSDRSTIILLSLLWYISTLLFTITVTGHLKSIRFLFWNSCFTKDVALYFGIHRCFIKDVSSQCILSPVVILCGYTKPHILVL